MTRDDRQVLDVPPDPVVRMREAFRWLIRELHLDERQTEDGRRIVECRPCGKRNRVSPVGPGVPRCGRCHHVLPWMAGAGDDEFADVAEQESMPVLVDMWAAWCGLSCMARPAVERIAVERAGELKVVEVDVLGAPRISRRYQVCGVPTLMLLRGGEVIARRYGEIQTPVLRSWLDDALRGGAEPASDGGAGATLRTPVAGDPAGARATRGTGPR